MLVMLVWHSQCPMSHQQTLVTCNYKLWELQLIKSEPVNTKKLFINRLWCRLSAEDK